MDNLTLKDELLKNISSKITFLENKIQYLIDENVELKKNLDIMQTSEVKLDKIINLLDTKKDLDNLKENSVNLEKSFEENISIEKKTIKANEEAILTEKSLIEEGRYYLERYLNKDDLTIALDYLGEASDNGDIEASYLLGDIYYKDKIIDDIDLAIEYYKRAAYGKNALATEKLIEIYLNKAEKEEYIYYYLLGDIYFNGELIEIDEDKYMKYYVLAAENGVNESINKLLKIYKQLSANGDNEATFLLGEIYNFGEWVERDEHEAFYWFDKACGLGNDTARVKCAEIALEIADGLFVEEEIKCIEWYNISSNNGNREAQYKLAQLFEKGIIVEKDEERARNLYIKSSENGYIKAITKVKIINPVKELFTKE
ncbi:MAG: tetratricopeptide repeat protein [Clostridium sp.]|uniref:tetratricopeptide repeat protein n=1 Tax=Clostridium sp. TaxID=1506 RepID=UPI003F2C75E4